ncbi:MAG: metallophosphoesterase [Micavibrio sp.]|nr:metallophosphoesterase [Micavibrio sp.]
MNDASPILTLGLNAKGRDFLIGDLHGAFALLDQALADVKFDPVHDRLFSLGDLIDRGPESVRCLEFLNKPWFFAVRGNHEDMFLKTYNDGNINWKMANFHREKNGMGWFFDQSAETLAQIAAAFKKLPFAIEVETARGTVGIVHAEIPVAMDWPTFRKELLLNDRSVLHAALWGRKRLEGNDMRGVCGIDRVFHGHSVQGYKPRQMGNCYYIDTGAVFGLMGKEDHFLTMTNLMTETESLRIGPANRVGKTHILDKSPSLAVPFGNLTPKP